MLEVEGFGFLLVLAFNFCYAAKEIHDYTFRAVPNF